MDIRAFAVPLSSPLLASLFIISWFTAELIGQKACNHVDLVSVALCYHACVSQVREKAPVNKSTLASKNLKVPPVTKPSEGPHWIRMMAAELAYRLNENTS